MSENWQTGNLDELAGYIKGLQREVAIYRASRDTALAERDAALRDMDLIVELHGLYGCPICEHQPSSPTEPCTRCRFGKQGFEWRGLCDENGGDV